jgi:hypothetical protein
MVSLVRIRVKKKQETGVAKSSKVVDRTKAWTKKAH